LSVAATSTKHTIQTMSGITLDINAYRTIMPVPVM